MSRAPEILEVNTFNVLLCSGPAHTQAVHRFFTPGHQVTVCRRCRAEVAFTVPPIYRDVPMDIPIPRARATL